MANKNDLAMELLLTIVPKGVVIDDVLAKVVEKLNPLFASGKRKILPTSLNTINTLKI